MISRHDLCNRSFRMSRGNGWTVVDVVFFLPDGRLFGTHHPNESLWAIVGDSVEFRDPSGTVTTRFTRITRGDAGWRLEGPYLLGDEQQPPTVHILEESASRPGPRPPAVAVMIRTHMIDDRVLELAGHLDNGRKNFDLYMTIDETNGRPETDFPNIVWHSLGKCPEIGLTQRRDRLIWWCGDFPFYFALAQIPHYRYYVMIEYDVHLTQGDASLLNDLADALINSEAGRIDAVGTRLQLEPRMDHPLHIPAYDVFETTYSYFFPFIALSKPAVSFLYAQRLLEAMRELPAEAVLHCESFVPSHLIRAGFNVVDLGAVLPDSYRNDLMILKGRQIGLPRSHANGFENFTRMIHPVYSDWAFLMRWLGYNPGDEWRQDILQRVNNGEFDLIPEPVRARLSAHITGGAGDAAALR